jgi:hypothetical protein
MAEEDTGTQPEETREKIVWGYVGKVTLWVSLLLSGLALERLGLSSSILSGVVPGEVQTLRADIAKTNQEVLAVREERDTVKIQIGYIVEAPDQLERCLSDIKQIEANLPNSPAAETS